MALLPADLFPGLGRERRVIHLECERGRVREDIPEGDGGGGAGLDGVGALGLGGDAGAK